MKNIYDNALGWYREQPLWKKVLFFLFLIVIAVLGIAYVVYRVMSKTTAPTHEASDTAHARTVSEMVADNIARQEQLEKDLVIKKALAAKLAKKRIIDHDKQIEVRRAIASASTFAEVDDILEGFK